MLLGGRNVILRTSCLFIRAFFSIRFVGLTNYISLIKGTSRLEIVGGHRNAFFAFLFPCICLENYHILLIKEQVGRCQRAYECNLLALFNYFCICLNSNHIFLIKEASRLEIVGGRRNAIKEEKTSAVAEIAHYHPSLHQLYQHIISNSACTP